MIQQPIHHRPVLMREVLAHLNVRPGGRYIDCTVGAGGHAAAVLAADPSATLLGIDRDEQALAIAGVTLAEYGERCSLVHGNYAEVQELAANHGWEQADGILMDLGVSSMQIDQARRGFSYRNDGPLDMRMDRTSPITAARVLNTADEQELVEVLREYGDVPAARKVAKAIIARREEKLWAHTAELAALLHDVMPRQKGRQTPVAARCFQALRIVVNNEFEYLEQGLDAALEMLAPNGRLVMISFHSGEDRTVKEAFRFGALDCVCPPRLPVCACDKDPWIRILTRKPLRASDDEVAENSRAAPAKLRAAEKI
jgi:16S rRNA (cytosine1402-N4)-methyltransferase